MTNKYINPGTLCEEIFGLPYPPNKEDLQTQYRKLVKVLHPDKGGNSQDFIRMKDAYEVLKPIAEKEETAFPIDRIAGRPLEDLGKGFVPRMPKCLDCEGRGYFLNVRKVYENWRDCPDCTIYHSGFKGITKKNCHRCKGQGVIKQVQVLPVNQICGSCDGAGQIYISNPVFNVSSFGK